MTLLFGLPLALVIGFALGRRGIALAAFGVCWYVFLALQTSYLAHVGRTGFGGVSGLEALQGPLYWIVQPLLFLAGVTLVLAGVRLRGRRGDHGDIEQTSA